MRITSFNSQKQKMRKFLEILQANKGKVNFVLNKIANTGRDRDMLAGNLG